jgi:hypothetical protein
MNYERELEKLLRRLDRRLSKSTAKGPVFDDHSAFGPEEPQWWTAIHQLAEELIGVQPVAATKMRRTSVRWRSWRSAVRRLEKLTGFESRTAKAKDLLTETLYAQLLDGIGHAISRRASAHESRWYNLAHRLVIAYSRGWVANHGRWEGHPWPEEPPERSL